MFGAWLCIGKEGKGKRGKESLRAQSLKIKDFLQPGNFKLYFLKLGFLLCPFFLSPCSCLIYEGSITRLLRSLRRAGD